jgi:hypothetical protein
MLVDHALDMLERKALEALRQEAIAEHTSPV